jgi:hypothetical protein
LSDESESDAAEINSLNVEINMDAAFWKEVQQVNSSHFNPFLVDNLKEK